MAASRRNVAFTPLFFQRIVAGALLIVVSLAIWGTSGARLRLRLRELRFAGNETTGVVTEIAAAGSRYIIRYRFHVDGAPHTGEMRAPLRQYADRYVRGDTTPVAYLAADPDVSVPRAKREIDDSFIDWSTGPDLVRACAYSCVVSLLLVAILFTAMRQRRLLCDGNILGARILESDAGRVRYEFTTPAGETFGRSVRLRRRAPAVGERVDVCWLPGRPQKSRLRSELRFVTIVE
jgi:hypothetical protein